MTRFLVTVQAYVDADCATTADNIAAEVARYLEEANETPGASDTTIQTAVAEKAPFRCEADIIAEEGNS